MDDSGQLGPIYVLEFTDLTQTWVYKIEVTHKFIGYREMGITERINCEFPKFSLSTLLYIFLRVRYAGSNKGRAIKKGNH